MNHRRKRPRRSPRIGLGSYRRITGNSESKSETKVDPRTKSKRKQLIARLLDETNERFGRALKKLAD